jgi:hypothetical protein
MALMKNVNQIETGSVHGVKLFAVIYFICKKTDNSDNKVLLVRGRAGKIEIMQCPCLKQKKASKNYFLSFNPLISLSSLLSISPPISTLCLRRQVKIINILTKGTVYFLVFIKNVATFQVTSTRVSYVQ